MLRRSTTHISRSLPVGQLPPAAVADAAASVVVAAATAASAALLLLLFFSSSSYPPPPPSSPSSFSPVVLLSYFSSCVLGSPSLYLSPPSSGELLSTLYIPGLCGRERTASCRGTLVVAAPAEDMIEGSEEGRPILCVATGAHMVT